MQNLVWVFNHVFLATTLMLNKNSQMKSFSHISLYPTIYMLLQHHLHCYSLYLEVTRSNKLTKTLTTDKLID